MSELQTYKGANWVDVKDSDELVIYDTSKPTVIREADDGMYHLTFRTINLEDGTGEEISDVCGTVTPQEVAIPKGSIMGEPQFDDEDKDFTVDFTYNEEVVATVSAVSLPDTVQNYYFSDLEIEEAIEEGVIDQNTGKILKDGYITIVFKRGVNIPVTIQSNNSEYGTVSPELIGVSSGTIVDAQSNVLTFAPGDVYEQTVTATATSSGAFQNWTMNGDAITDEDEISITEATTFEAVFKGGEEPK